MGTISDFAPTAWQRNLEENSKAYGGSRFVPVNKPMDTPVDTGGSPSGASDIGQFAASESRDVGDVQAKQGTAAAAGRAVRGAVQAPLVAAGSAFPDLRDVGSSIGKAVKSGFGTISNFARGFTGAPAPTEQPAAPAVTASVQGTGASAAPVAAPAADDEPARPSNVRAYLRDRGPTSDQIQRAYAPTVYSSGPIATAANNLNPADIAARAKAASGTADQFSAMGQAKRELAAYGAETGRMQADTGRMAVEAEAPHRAAQTEATQQGTIAARYNLEQQKQLKSLTMRLEDPNLSSKDRRNLEQQLLILHGKTPRPLGKFQIVPGRLNPMTGMLDPSHVIDTATGEVTPLPKEEPPGPPPGMKVIGTSGGKPVYEDANGKRFTQ